MWPGLWSLSPCILTIGTAGEDGLFLQCRPFPAVATGPGIWDFGSCFRDGNEDQDEDEDGG